MLQQTRVDQARPYFERFISAFPEVQDLASAPLDEVLLNWEGLGYYSRARNLHKAAKIIVDLYEGALPKDHKELLSLPGIGPYTAAAIASIAFNQPYGVLDGNVIRVISRLTCNDQDTSKVKTKRVLQQQSDLLVAPSNPGDFNQAMMELGATQCKPSNPACPTCPVQTFCCGFKTDSVDLFPITKKKAPPPHYHLVTGIVKNKDGQLLIQQRAETQMLGGMWEFPGTRIDTDTPKQLACIEYFQKELDLPIEIISSISPINHAYSHFKITVHAFTAAVGANYRLNDSNQHNVRWTALADLDNFAFHRAHRKLIDAYRQHIHTPSLFDPS